MLARANWARWQVQFMACHTSSTIDTYIDQAWSDVTVQWAKSTASGGPVPKTSGLAAMDLSIKELKELMEERADAQANKKTLYYLKSELEEVKEMTKKMKGTTPPLALLDANSKEAAMEQGIKYVRSSRCGLIHMVPSGTEIGDAALWRAACTWRYARFGRYEEVSRTAGGEWRKRCLEANE